MYDRKKYTRTHYEKHREEILAKKAEFYKENKERILARKRELYHLKKSKAV